MDRYTNKSDKRIADYTIQDVRSGVRRAILRFLLGCIIGVILLVAFAAFMGTHAQASTLPPMPANCTTAAIMNRWYGAGRACS